MRITTVDYRYFRTTRPDAPHNVALWTSTDAAPFRTEYAMWVALRAWAEQHRSRPVLVEKRDDQTVRVSVDETLGGTPGRAVNTAARRAAGGPVTRMSTAWTKHDGILVATRIYSY